MSHVRQQIRKKVIEELRELESIEGRVYELLVRALRRDQLPCLVVRAGAEELEGPDDGTIGENPQRERIFSLRVIAVAEASELDYVDGQGFPEPKTQDDLDQLIVDVEKKLASDVFLGGVSKFLYISRVDEPEFSDDGDGFRVAITMHWNVHYVTAAKDPETSL